MKKLIALICLFMVTATQAQELFSGALAAQGATVLYKDRVVEITQNLPDATDLWVQPADLTRINDFELCLADLCIPVLQDRDSDMYVTRAGQGWFNITGLADRLQQAWVVDHEDGVWSLGGVLPNLAPRD